MKIGVLGEEFEEGRDSIKLLKRRWCSFGRKCERKHWNIFSFLGLGMVESPLLSAKLTNPIENHALENNIIFKSKAPWKEK